MRFYHINNNEYNRIKEGSVLDRTLNNSDNNPVRYPRRNIYRQTQDTYKALVNTIIPRTPGLAYEYGIAQYYGALDLHTDEYIIFTLNSLTIPLAQPAADMLNIAARNFIALSPLNQLQVLMKLKLYEFKDENGFLPVIHYEPSEKDAEKRNKLAIIASNILRAAGAKTIIRANWPPEIFIHITSTMRIGYVVDTNCEAYQVKRLYIADNSVLYNGIGGPNPTLTTQALATRTAEKIIIKYFS